jgi:hypothetical protein
MSIRDPCHEENILKEQRRVLNNKIKIIHSECETSKYNVIYTYFNTERSSTYKDLLNALMHYYKDEKKKNMDFVLTIESFLDLFEKDTMKIKNFKKQHVFEGLCKILLMYNYDNGVFGIDKQFFVSLEKFIKNPISKTNVIEKEEIINENINVSSEGGVVDIFFKTKKTGMHCKWICDCQDNAETKEKSEYILIQNKYYSKEKSNLYDYDVASIFAKAKPLYELNENIKIILMVNNKQSLSDKLSRSRDTNKFLIDSIYGVYEINEWFNRLLYDLYNAKNIDDFLEKIGGKSKTKPELIPRFHQMYFTNATISYYNSGYKKFIWGAVPRSGKSFMIGDLISKRRQLLFNDIIIILGAKSETESQFINDLFCEFSNFDDYGIISNDKMTVKNCSNFNQYNKKNIFIFSQEWFKDKIQMQNGIPVFNFKNKELYEHLFYKGNRVDIYFDEIHKGGSTDKSENILNAIHALHMKIDIFIMVTATFAKPSIKYKTNFIDIKEPKLLQWSYEDQQLMKNIQNETKMEMMVNTREVGPERDILINIFEHYKFMYGNEYLDVISKQYSLLPELVLVQPYNIINTLSKDISCKENDIVMDCIFKNNLNCDACIEKQTLTSLRDPNRIFFDFGRVQKFIQLLVGNLHPTKSVYGYLKSIGAPDYSSKHTELWFIPDYNLYVNPDECRTKDKCNTSKNEFISDENMDKSNLPNIEPLSRGIAFALMQNDFFKQHYNILIVHNTKSYFKDKENGYKITYEHIFKDTGISVSAGSKNLSKTIEEYEKETYNSGKNLIILTGAKLRLGISLPCVDIAFNFDNIKSIDVNYQTMFRVLTERYNKPKTHGYYVDFNLNRFIQFLYEYSNTYTSAKHITSIKENIQHLQGLLLLFNVNGIGLVKMDPKKEIELYNSLLVNFKLNENGYNEYYAEFNNITNLIKKSLIQVSSSELQKFKFILNTVASKNARGKKIILKEGKNIKNPVYSTMDDDDMDDDFGVEDMDNISLINTVSDFLPRIIFLIALFSDKKHYNCGNIVECLDNSIRQINEFGNMCNCSTVAESNILSCYFNTPVYHDKLLKIIQICKELFQNPDNKQLYDTGNFIFNNIIEMKKERRALIYSMTPEDIQNKIEQYLPVREEKKDKNGEVFTPVKLIKEIMDKIPPHVWTNPELKWLDPANGIGNFPMIVYEKLLEKLPDKYNGPNGKYSNEPEKKRHIIEKMLFMIEIDAANVKISRKIFGSNANICCASFLDDTWKKCFDGVEKFDIIIGNPPFQTPKKEDTGTTAGLGKLWDKFIIKSLDLLVENGYLGFITPPGWRKPENKLYELMTKENQLLYLRIYGEKQGQHFFNVSQRVDLYVIQKHPKTKKSEIIDELDNKIELDLAKWSFLPSYKYNIISKILTNSDDGIDIIYDTFYHSSKNMNKTKKEKTGNFKYPVIHGITEAGLVFIYANENDKGHFGVSKVILNSNRNQYPVNDYNGEYGMSELSFGIPITSKKQGDDIVNAINSDEFKEIIKATKWGAFQTDYKMFKYFKPDFYKYFLDRETAGLKIKQFVTKKRREKHNVTKKSKGGHTRKKRSIFFPFV